MHALQMYKFGTQV